MLTDLLIIDILIYSLCQSNSDGRHGCVHNIYYENRFDVYDSTTIIMNNLEHAFLARSVPTGVVFF